MSLDDMLNKIVIDIGVPIPKYDYEKRKFVISVPLNISMGFGVTGIEANDYFDSFEKACEAIINWHTNNNQQKT